MLAVVVSLQRILEHLRFARAHIADLSRRGLCVSQLVQVFKLYLLYFPAVLGPRATPCPTSFSVRQCNPRRCSGSSSARTCNLQDLNCSPAGLFLVLHVQVQSWNPGTA
jgi:hypothetical protein